VEGAISRGVRRVFLEVRESNGGARAFYSGLGFAQQGRRRKYYQDPVEDALLLSRTF
jgi:ribosomal-protein-alanine N-acetyltransferase